VEGAEVRARDSLVIAAACVALAAPGAALAAGPPPLSTETDRVDVSSPRGAGVFGRWAPDARGLPSYLYEIDHRTAPAAAQPELNGKREAWHQVGNDHIVGFGFNSGWFQLWSQDRVYHWVNLAEPDQGQYGGGYGYLRVGGRTLTTLYEDLPASAGATRRFGTGYYERELPERPVSVRERVYAPWGDDPILLHDVVLRNHTDAPVDATWFEYWGVNPTQQLPGKRVHRGLEQPRFDAGTSTLTARQIDPQDARPQTIYAAALHAPVAGFDTDGASFFGAGGRARPAVVEADRAGNTIAPPVAPETTGKTMFALRSPVTIPAGGSLTLRYAYGEAPAGEIPELVGKYRQAADPFAASAAEWRRWLPQVSFGPGREWLSRELQWDAYALRSGTTYEEECGHHIISQGGYYQYSFGFQGAYRDPLQHMLPMIWMEPEIAREVLRYSAVEQPSNGFIPYAMLGNCRRFDFGSSNDLDVWLLLAAAEYGLATRDMEFFDERLPFADGGRARLWEHLKVAFRHQESQRGPNGGYVMGATGDWSDFSTQFGPMTESILVVAQAAYIYPRLAELAELRGDDAFAAELRATAAELREVLARQWTGRGWYARAWLGTKRHGEGVIYGEPQPWALLSGTPSPDQARTLVDNIRRFLTGVGAPHGPAVIGSAQSPARDDPEVTETTLYSGVGSNNAVFVGGVWYAINGWLTWALAEQDGIVPNARELALDEFERNTLTAHASAFPEHWNGVTSVDDACRAYHDPEPSRCGIGLSTTVAGWIMHQPAWSLFGAIRLAGVTPTRDGYLIAPHLPLERFSLRLPTIGVAAEPGELRGYLRPERGGGIELRVRLPHYARKPRAFVDGRRVGSERDGDEVVFALPTRAGEAADWAVTYG
jgi:Glycosyl hydrolase 36 superfamily, catalytic domain/Glycosyltransferase family 36